MTIIVKAIVLICVALWAACAIYAFIAFQETAPTGSGFTRGYNRLEAFFGYQLFALGAATVGYLVGRMSSMAGLSKWAARLPIIASGGFFAIVIALFLAAVVIGRLSGQ